jgi:tRNA G18 (ribose-2'-O)-methylase SpoU
VIHRIDRADDPRIANYADVGHHERLRARGLFVAEGRLIVRRLIEARRFVIDSIVVTPPALSDLGALLECGEWPVHVCAPELLQRVTGFDFHRGCLALARRPVGRTPISNMAWARRLLALEGIGNPDNMGGLFRVAAAFGSEGVVLTPTCADPFYRKAIRTSMGSVLRVPFTTAERWPEDLEVLRAAGMQVVALTPDARATALRDFAAALAPDARLVLMFGAEGPGLSPDVLRAADRLVRIPISAPVDSLNVVVAAGIVLASLPNRGAQDQGPA